MDYITVSLRKDPLTGWRWKIGPDMGNYKVLFGIEIEGTSPSAFYAMSDAQTAVAQICRAAEATGIAQ